MLDENLPTFRFKPSSDNSLHTILYFTQNGSEPAPEYILRRPDRTLPAARNKYAVALCDPFSPDVIYGEIVIDPEWSQPTLSAAEIRAQQQNGAPPAPAVPLVPDSFNVLLYNPDVVVTVKMVAGSWGKSDTWEFEVPTQTFRTPSTSALDREHGSSAAAAELIPKLMFRWKKDGRLTKDMSCFMSGMNVGGKRNKEPDITVALFKAGRDSTVTVYEPNMQRVEVEDRKGWEVVVLLAAEAIKDLYLMPRQDVFNVSGGPPTAVNGAGRKNSRPTGATPPVPTMSGAMGNMPSSSSAAAVANITPAAASTAEIDAETRRLAAMVEKEERERQKRDLAEEKRIKKMLEEEEREQRRRQTEIDKETERLRREFGMEGQDFSARPHTSSSPPLPPRHQNQVHFAPPPPGAGGGWLGPGGAPPPRPVSAGPAGQGQGQNSWWRGPGTNPTPQPQQPPPQQSSGRRRNGSGGLGLHHPAASVSGFFGLGREEERNKVKKKRSMHW